MYYLFEDSPARHADFIEITGTRALDEQQQQSLCETEQLSKKKRAALEGHCKMKSRIWMKWQKQKRCLLIFK
uniref:Uncharacterized protein n=1 Tax=Romanomermis culicivorax TaxID=13658 RepID=A0A915JR83_ROMCU